MTLRPQEKKMRAKLRQRVIIFRTFVLTDQENRFLRFCKWNFPLMCTTFSQKILTKSSIARHCKKNKERLCGVLVYLKNYKKWTCEKTCFGLLRICEFVNLNLCTIVICLILNKINIGSLSNNVRILVSLYNYPPLRWSNINFDSWHSKVSSMNNLNRTVVSSWH